MLRAPRNCRRKAARFVKDSKRENSVQGWTKVLAGALTWGSCLVAAIAAASDFSAAEQKVFLNQHLHNISRSTTLNYAFHASDPGGTSFDDRVVVSIKIASGKTPKKTVSVDYLSGEHQVSLPAIGDAESNPVILYFLEMDVREMHRRTGGNENYFRKRIRLALAEHAEVRDTKLKFGGREISASEVRTQPYLDDPLKDKFGSLASKTYIFIVSDAVPGGVYQLRTQADAPAPATAPIEETLTFDRAGA